MLNQNEIKALISLLDDSDQEVRQHVETKILSMGDLIVPFLEAEWEQNFNPNVQSKIENLIHNVQLNSLKIRLKQWYEEEQNNLLKGVWLVATYQYPDLDYHKLEEDVEQVYYEAWRSHRNYASPSDQIKSLNNVFFGKLSFSSNKQNFHAPGNSMINVILETRRGNPIGLSVVYMLIARRLRMPIYGVNLPNLFVLTYKNDDTQFYINTFNRGAIFPKAEIDSYLEQLKLKPQAQFYEPCSIADIVRRILRNLILAFDKLSDQERSNEVKSLLNILE